MVLRGSRMNKVHFINVPEGIPVGIVVGIGGSQCKQLEAKHGVRCTADRNTRRVQVEGSREGVDAATREIHGWFDVWRADQERDQQSTPTIHKVAVAMANENGASSTWRFEHRDAGSVAADPSVKDYDYRLVAIDPSPYDEYEEEKDEEAVPSGQFRPWIFEFDSSFRQQMQAEVAAITTTDPSSSPVKLKVAFGLQCFAIPDDQVASGKTHSWRELQSLHLYAQLKPRWSNMLNRKSNALADLADKLLTRVDEATTFKTELVVYITKRHCRNDDVSIKYRWERDAWVLVERKPIRVAHALYNIAQDNETAFRLRAYSRQAAPASLGFEELVNSLEIATAFAHDPFSTIVAAGRNFSSRFQIRSFAVRTTTTVEWRGLRFTIQYGDATRTPVSLTCRMLEGEDAEAMALPDAMETLLDKVLAVTAQE